MSQFIIKEPIDYDLLSESYRACRWYWATAGAHRGHVPTPEEIERAVNEFKSYVTGESPYISSGGITVRLVSDKRVVSIDSKLHAALAEIITHEHAQQ